MPTSRSRSTLTLGVTATLAFAWLAFRASYQSITIDEATTWLVFAGRTPDFLFFPANNNHLLNTILIYCATHLLGLSHLTVRLPALLGAAIYILSALTLVRRLPATLILTWPLFACLVLNPLLADFLIAARGYSLALGFLFAGIAIGTAEPTRSPLRQCALCSLCAALSFLASFAFAFAAASMLAVLWIVRFRRNASLAATLTATILPGLLLTVLIAGYPLAHWPAGELWYGSHSLAEMYDSLAKPSFIRPDPIVIPATAYHALNAIAPYLFPLIAILLVAQLLCLRPAAALLPAAILLLTITMHSTAFHAFGLLLPKHRTGIFLIALATLLTGAIAAIPPPHRLARSIQTALIANLWILAGFYLICFRYSYFSEWRWNAETHESYTRVHHLEKAGCAKTVGVSWRYAAAFNFYRDMYGEHNRQEFQPGTALPEQRDVYLLHPIFDHDFIARNHLRQTYTGESGELTLAESPAVTACESSQLP